MRLAEPSAQWPEDDEEIEVDDVDMAEDRELRTGSSSSSSSSNSSTSSGDGSVVDKSNSGSEQRMVDCGSESSSDDMCFSSGSSRKQPARRKTSNNSASSGGGGGGGTFSSTSPIRKRRSGISARERNLRRLESNERERMRMHSLNDAFEVSSCIHTNKPTNISAIIQQYYQPIFYPTCISLVPTKHFQFSNVRTSYAVSLSVVHEQNYSICPQGKSYLCPF